MANILLDPGFETPLWSTYWPGYTTSGAHNDAQDTSVFNTGASSVSVVASGGVVDGGRNQTSSTNPLLGLLAKGVWLFSGWVKTGASITNALCVIRETTGFAVVAGGHVNTANQGWTFFSGYFTSDGLRNYDVIVGLGSYGTASDGTAWFDDISLEMIHEGYDRIHNQYPNLVVGNGMSRSEGAT